MSSKTSDENQLRLDFPRVEEDARPLLESGNYKSALVALRGWKNWPEGQLALVGASRSGKTRLLRAWAAETNAAFISAENLRNADMDEIASLAISALAVDDCDQVGSGLAVLAALNLCRERNAPILLSGLTPPPGWYDDPRDLQSRLQALPVHAIGLPDDDVLKDRLEDACLRRHLHVPDPSLKYLSERMDASWQSIERVADQIEITRGRAYNLRFARKVLTELGMDPG